MLRDGRVHDWILEFGQANKWVIQSDPNFPADKRQMGGDWQVFGGYSAEGYQWLSGAWNAG